MPKRKASRPDFFERLKRFWFAIVDFAYPVCYRIGIRTLRLGHQTARTLKKAFAPWARLFSRLWEQFVWRHVRHWGEEWKRFFLGFPLAGRKIAEAWKRHPLEGIWRVLITPFVGIYRHRRGLLTTCNVLAPIAAAYAMVACIGYWGNTIFALRLEYMGQTIGYIADESVFDEAASLAEERVTGVDSSFTVNRTPVLTVTLAPEDALLSETELCDVLLSSHSADVEKLSGVYVNGRFVGTVASSKKAEALLQALLDSHRENVHENDEVSFLQDVEIVDGLYPVSTKTSLEELKTLFTDRTASEQTYVVQEGDTLSSVASAFGMTGRQLVELNEGLSGSSMKVGRELVVGEAYAYLDVQIVRIEKTEESIPYDTEEVEDPNRYIGDNYVKVYGEEGIRTYTERVVYVDGEEISRQNVSIEVTKEPITEIYAKGAYNVNYSASPGVATGYFVWPVPSSYNITYGYGDYVGHRGLDIIGDYGAAILAVDGGVVVDVNYSGWGSGWGSYVLIDHGNGYMTRYAHLSSVHVNYGEYITQGQMIGRMGESGYAYGVHLHLEVYRDGVRVDPYPFLP